MCEGRSHAAVVFAGEEAVLYSGTRGLFERAGFTFERAKGAKNTVMAIPSNPRRPQPPDHP